MNFSIANITKPVINTTNVTKLTKQSNNKTHKNKENKGFFNQILTFIKNIFGK